MADGRIIFDTGLDNKKLEKQLESIGGKIKKTEEELTQKKTAQSGLKMELDDAKRAAQETENRIKALRNEMASLKAKTGVDGQLNPDAYTSALERQKSIAAELKEQESILKRQDSETKKLDGQYAGITDKVNDLTGKLDMQKQEYGEISQRIEKINSASSRMGGAMQEAGKHADRFFERVKNLASRVFVFTVITTALRSFRTWMGKVIKTNTEASAAVARLKGALLTLAQPLVEIIIPAFVILVNVITRVVSALAQLFSMLTGKSISSSKDAAKALNYETKALDAAGSAAENAGKSMANFDEINQLSAQNQPGSTGGGASEAAPDFDFGKNLGEGQLENILNWVKLIGAALLAWKLSSTFLDGLKTFVGLILAINGATHLAQAAWDAWQNGLNADNLKEMLKGALELTAGLAIAFGKTGAGIGLLVSGLTLLVSGIRDAMENGWNFENTLSTIAGLFMSGLGISLMTGSWIPLLLAGIASLLLAITVTFGDGEKLIEDIKLILQGFRDFFVGVFTGDIALAMNGIGEIFDGLRGVTDNVLEAVKNLFISFLDWLDEKTGGRFHGIIETAKDFLNGFFDWAKDSFAVLWDALETIFKGVIKFISGVFTSDWDLAWQGVKDIFKGIWNGIIWLLGTAINAVVKGINWVIQKIISASADVLDLIPGIDGKKIRSAIPAVPEWKIPYLARGAVIPPNREFMAVLGDQRSGNNIEAPEALIRKIVREEGGGGANSRLLQLLQAILNAIQAGAVVMIDRDQIGRVVYDVYNSENRRHGVKLTTR